jgi:hypothetical protein
MTCMPSFSLWATYHAIPTFQARRDLARDRFGVACDCAHLGVAFTVATVITTEKWQLKEPTNHGHRK